MSEELARALCWANELGDECACKSLKDCEGDRTYPGMPERLEAALNAQGYAIVPLEPTEEMVNSGWSEFQSEFPECVVDIYKAMLAATPKPKQAVGGEMIEVDYSLPRPIRAIKALREPAAPFVCVPNTIRQSTADVIEELYRAVEVLEQRQRDTSWLQMAALQILKEKELMPSSAELIEAHKRALAEECAQTTPQGDS
ncbi:MAG: hypothetical protein ACR2QC_04165 [Gammaproteobacteria bacterium]